MKPVNRNGVLIPVCPHCRLESMVLAKLEGVAEHLGTP